MMMPQLATGDTYPTMEFINTYNLLIILIMKIYGKEFETGVLWCLWCPATILFNNNINLTFLYDHMKNHLGKNPRKKK